MRNNYRLASAVMGLLVGIAASSSVAPAQNTTAQSASLEKVSTTLKKNQLVFTVGGATTTITADRIVRNGKDYTLRGDFLMTSSKGVLYKGKDAEVSLHDATPSDASRNIMISVTTYNSITNLETGQSTTGKPAVANRFLQSIREQTMLVLQLNAKQ